MNEKKKWRVHGLGKKDCAPDRRLNNKNAFRCKNEEDSANLAENVCFKTK